MKPRDRTAWYRIKARYGITEEDYMALLAAQDGLCAVCRGRRPYWLQVDHDHAGELPEAVRGLLCRRCNKLLRDVRDNRALLLAAARYLAHPPWRRVSAARAAVEHLEEAP